MSKNIPLKSIESKIVYQNPWIKIREDITKDTSGNEGIYGVMESNDSVMIAALNNQKELYLIYKFSYPTQCWNWELPGGGDDNEDILTASKRELYEETGLTSNNLTILDKTRVCNGLMTEHTSIVLATSLTLSERPPADDTDSIVDGKFFAFDQIHEMIKSGEIDDNQSLTAIYLTEIYLKNKAS